MDVPASLLDFSLVQGGPRVFGRRRLLARFSRASLPWRTVIVALVAWLPLLVLSLLHGQHSVSRAFLRDVALHVQLLVSLPILIAAERYIDVSISAAVRQFVISELVDAKHLAAYERLARQTMRVRHHPAVEGGLLLASYALFFVDVPLQANAGWIHARPGGPLTLAADWYLLVSTPLLRFLLLRWVWRGVLWAFFLFRVSRLPLALVPTHPDVAGGLGFLGTAQASFSPIVLAVACTLTAQHWARHPEDDLTQSATRLLAFALLSVAVLFAPLLPFCRQLLLAKRHGDHAFSAVAAWHSRRFEQRWFHRELPADLEPLSAPDFSSLTDLGTSFATARSMRWFPVGPRAALAVLAAAMAPMLPLLLIDRRFVDVVMAIGKSVF